MARSNERSFLSGETADFSPMENERIPLLLFAMYEF